MAVRTTISLGRFIELFKSSNRSDSFTDDGLEKIYNYYDQNDIIFGDIVEVYSEFSEFDLDEYNRYFFNKSPRAIEKIIQEKTNKYYEDLDALKAEGVEVEDESPDFEKYDEGFEHLSADYVNIADIEKRGYVKTLSEMVEHAESNNYKFLLADNTILICN